MGFAKIRMGFARFASRSEMDSQTFAQVRTQSHRITSGHTCECARNELLDSPYGFLNKDNSSGGRTLVRRGHALEVRTITIRLWGGWYRYIDGAHYLPMCCSAGMRGSAAT